jgi:hypothetical protein
MTRLNRARFGRNLDSTDLPSNIDETADDEPSPQELAAIEAEWPLIAAELDRLDAEIAILNAVGGPSGLDRRRLRRAGDRVLREAATLASQTRQPPRGWAA